MKLSPLSQQVTQALMHSSAVYRSITIAITQKLVQSASVLLLISLKSVKRLCCMQPHSQSSSDIIRSRQWCYTIFLK